MLSVPRSQGWRNEKKVGGLTLPLNDCTEAGVQGLHSEEFHDFTCSEMHILVVSIVRNFMILHALRCTFWCNSTLSLSLKTYPCFFPHWPLKKWWGLAPPTPQSGGGLKTPQPPPAPPPLPPRTPSPRSTPQPPPKFPSPVADDMESTRMETIISRVEASFREAMAGFSHERLGEISQVCRSVEDLEIRMRCQEEEAFRRLASSDLSDGARGGKIVAAPPPP